MHARSCRCQRAHSRCPDGRAQTAEHDGPGGMIYDVAATEDVAADVHRLADGSAGLLRLITPEGELGRLGDNLFRPTFVAALPNRLLVEFEDRLAVSGR